MNYAAQDLQAVRAWLRALREEGVVAYKDAEIEVRFRDGAMPVAVSEGPAKRLPKKRKVDPEDEVDKKLFAPLGIGGK